VASVRRVFFCRVGKDVFLSHKAEIRLRTHHERARYL
jgi:hypothetical protein